MLKTGNDLSRGRPRGRPLSSLRLSMGGGAAVQPAVARCWQEVTGGVLLEGYGLSETSPVLTINRADARSFRGGIGLPLPSTEISIRDEQGREVAPGESGELCARGPQVMRGYWQRPEDNAKVFTADGYFRTGDIARQDDEGYFRAARVIRLTEASPVLLLPASGEKVPEGRMRGAQRAIGRPSPQPSPRARGETAATRGGRLEPRNRRSLSLTHRSLRERSPLSHFVGEGRSVGLRPVPG